MKKENQKTQAKRLQLTQETLRRLDVLGKREYFKEVIGVSPSDFTLTPQQGPCTVTW